MYSCTHQQHYQHGEQNQPLYRDSLATPRCNTSPMHHTSPNTQAPYIIVRVVVEAVINVNVNVIDAVSDTCRSMFVAHLALAREPVYANSKFFLLVTVFRCVFLL